MRKSSRVGKNNMKSSSRGKQESSSRRKKYSSTVVSSYSRSDGLSRSVYTKEYSDDATVSSSSGSETSYHRRSRHTSNKGRDYGRKNEERRAVRKNEERRPVRGQRERSIKKGQSSDNYRTESSRRNDSKVQSRHVKSARHIKSFDTAENSESKLQDIGMVVKASDLSDYSDQFTLDTEEKAEFENFVQKHEARGDTYESNSVYSLDRDERETSPSEPSDDTSGIVEGKSGEIANDNCAVRVCFCMGDDESLQGSYGGLRNGEILIAASTLSTHDSMADDWSPPDTSGRSDTRRVERLESEASTAEARDDQESATTTPSWSSSGMKCFFFSWMTGSSSPSEGETNSKDSIPSEVDSASKYDESKYDESRYDEDDDDDHQDHEDVDFTQIHGQESTLTASERSRSVVWERPDVASAVSTEVSLEEDRARAIAQKARSENILSKFKKEEETEKPNLTFDDETRDTEKEQDEDEVIQVRSLEMDEATQSSSTLPYQRTLVLGDNVEVTGISEVEAGNGDTGFVIFLRVCQDSLTEEGKEAAKRAAATRRSGLVANAPTTWQSLDDVSFEVLVTVVDDADGLVTETPRILIENTASKYLENLCQLSEASYYCLDRSTKRYATKVIQSQQHQYGTMADLQTTSTHSRGSLGTDQASMPASNETTAQFMFCINAMNLIPHMSDNGNTDEKLACTTSSSEQSPIQDNDDQSIDQPPSQDNDSFSFDIEGENGDEEIDHHSFSFHIEEKEEGGETDQHQSKPEEMMIIKALSSKADVDPAEVDEYFESSVVMPLRVDESEVDMYIASLNNISEIKASPLRAPTCLPKATSNKKPVNQHPPATIISTREDSDSSSERLSVRSSSRHSNGEDSLQGTRYMESNNSAGGSSSNHSEGSIRGYLAFLDERDANMVKESSANENFSAKSALLISKVEAAAQEARKLVARLDYRDNDDGDDEDEFHNAYHSDDAVLSESSNSEDMPPKEGRHPALRADLLTSIDSPPIPTHVAKLRSSPDMIETTRDPPDFTIETKLTSDEQQQLESYEERARLSQQLLLADSSARLVERSSLRRLEHLDPRKNSKNEVVEFEKSRIDHLGSLSQQRPKTASVASSSHGSSTSNDDFFDTISRNSSNISSQLSVD